ncbi:hypothetical protein YC2023_040041 [Brassica napus]
MVKSFHRHSPVTRTMNYQDYARYALIDDLKPPAFLGRHRRNHQSRRRYLTGQPSSVSSPSTNLSCIRAHRKLKKKDRCSLPLALFDENHQHLSLNRSSNTPTISTFSLLNFLAFGEFTMAGRSKSFKRARFYESDSEQISDHENILKNLKHDKNENVAKGQAVKNQKVSDGNVIWFTWRECENGGDFSGSNYIPDVQARPPIMPQVYDPNLKVSDLIDPIMNDWDSSKLRSLLDPHDILLGTCLQETEKILKQESVTIAKSSKGENLESFKM